MESDTNDRSLVVRFFDSFLQERNIKWMLGLGMLILFGSSIKLIGTHWSQTSAVWKHVILLGYTAGIALTAKQCFWRLGLRTTGTVLMALTVMLMPITFLAWQWVWSEAASDVRSSAFSLVLLGINLCAGWKMADSIFRHFLNGRQSTFVVCYLLLSAAGALIPQLQPVWPAAALSLWAVMAVGAMKVHRHVFWLTEERRLPRIFGFFPIALLGTQFLLLFAFYLAPQVPLQWLGLACVLFAVPVLSAADAAARVFQQRTGNLVRPIPLAIVLPMFMGLTLCLVGMCIAASELPQPTALVPTAAIAAGLMALAARRTDKPAFVWAMLVCAMLAYNFSYVFFMDLVRLIVHQGAHAVREQRLPYAFYGLTYVPFLVALTATAAWLGRRAGVLFARPMRRFAVGLSCLLLAAAFQHQKAVFPVSVVMVGIFALQLKVLARPYLLAPAIAAFLGAAIGLPAFATGVCGWSVPPDMSLLCLGAAAMALWCPGQFVDRYVAKLSSAAGDRRLCLDVSLWLTLLLVAECCRRLLGSWFPGELLLSGAIVLGMTVVHALVRKSPRVAETALVFAGFAAVVQALHLGMPAVEVISGAIAYLLILWGISYYLRPAGTGSSTFGVASRNVAHVGLTLLLVSYVLPRLAWGTLSGIPQTAWPWLVLVVIWAFDAARRFASQMQMLLGCIGFMGLTTAGLTHILGPETSREWLLAGCAAAALAGALALIWLGRRMDAICAASVYSPDDERRFAVLTALSAPLSIVVMAVLIGVACASTVLFIPGARVAGAIAIPGFLCLGMARQLKQGAVPLRMRAFPVRVDVAQTNDSIFERQMHSFAVVAFNWQLISGLIEFCVPGVALAWPNPEIWLVPVSIPLALLAAASSLAFLYRQLSGASQLELRGGDLETSGIIRAHTLLMHLVTAGALVASLALLPQELSNLQALMAGATFVLVIARSLWQACRRQDVRRVWAAEALAGIAFAYLALFGVIQLGSGLAPFILLGTGMTLWGIGQATTENRSVGILSPPFHVTGLVLPMAGVVLATGRHLAGISPTMLGINSLALFGAAAFYFWNGLALRRRRLVVLSAVILNVALVLLWRELSWSDPQLFLIPLGLSVLGLVELLQAEIPLSLHNPLRYAGALVILISPTFHIVTGSWLHLFTLMAASVAVTLLSIGLRVRALMYTGVAFLIADLAAMLVRGSIDRPNLLWIAGVGLGTAVLVLGALCENRREVLLQRLRILTTELESWK
jgi:hypothetical protein